MKTLYVTDMDGTLLRPDSRVSYQSSSIISDLSNQGALITVATARTPATVEPLLRGTHLNAPAIVMTGAALYNREDNIYSHVNFFPSNHLTTVLEICHGLGFFPFVYVLAQDGKLDVYHGGKGLNKHEDAFYLERCRLKLKRFHLSELAPARAKNATILLFAMSERTAIEKAAAQLKEHTDCAISCYPDIFNPEVALLEIFAPGVSKAIAVEKMKARTGAEKLVVFGDNLNDLPMFKIADVAVAVENALPEVKAAADIVIEPNYTDSVARFMASDFHSK